MGHAREVDAARRRFLRDGRDAVAGGVVRPEVLASWERSAGVDTGRLAAVLIGVDDGPRTAAARRVVDRVHARDPDLDASVLVVDGDGVVLVRRDGDTALAEILDALWVLPGYAHAEHVVGTTAAALALHDGVAAAVEGPEHLHPALGVLAGAAAPVEAGDLAVVVVRHAEDGAVRDLPLARTLAREIGDEDAAARRGRILAVHDALAAAAAQGASWVVATDGDDLVLGAGARRLPPADQQILADLALAGLALESPDDPYHVDLPSGGCAEVAVTGIRHGERLVGCVVAGSPAVDEGGRREAEARRRQGSHVAPTSRRDFAADMRGDERAHAEARVRANRDLLTPSLRARQELAANLGQRRHQVLVGEAGVGKRTLAVEQFVRLHRDGTVTVLDAAEDGVRAAEPLERLVHRPPSRPHLVVLRGLQGVTPLSARRLDEQLGLLLARASSTVVVACLDTTSVDASRPYGLLLRHFHETVRVPPLRHRADELADIALSVLRAIGGGRSLRLSHQVIRVLEGYAWPGNINELEDVLRYVVARKPVGVIQAPDLPALCFTSRPRLTMLETAQADAIIQALYEARGNRYQAAAMLGIARSSLYRKIDAFGISYIA
ncbi:transcriptional regulator of acetoin/glycerol metabolism [Actinomycetospora succinea]|uniref:Transcriptional regulator of acetoin/glycerol metabolism n=1 Tax=Actinomycetospora succinea TaxID=663603 RepID=A0A4R6VLN9_9PSEU|nr:helix-turn-helix domain-containing protein [Actinomycetospora succinea]TDQ62832.1 transcriptional regulator of acetoin/glycerol metabolism [Actinomycetospora succinea]